MFLRGINVYNNFYRLKNSVEATLRQIKVDMELRLDTIEQLPFIVKSCTNFEQGTFTEVTEMRATIASANLEGLSDLERDSRLLLGRLFAVAENYPDLKASTTVFIS